jgi:hypothetical protein
MSDTERPCGCPWDYHLADCPIRTSRYSSDDAPDPDDWYERED